MYYEIKHCLVETSYYILEFFSARRVAMLRKHHRLEEAQKQIKKCSYHVIEMTCQVALFQNDVLTPQANINLKISSWVLFTSVVIGNCLMHCPDKSIAVLTVVYQFGYVEWACLVHFVSNSGYFTLHIVCWVKPCQCECSLRINNYILTNCIK